MPAFPAFALTLGADTRMLWLSEHKGEGLGKLGFTDSVGVSSLNLMVQAIRSFAHCVNQ